MKDNNDNSDNIIQQNQCSTVICNLLSRERAAVGMRRDPFETIEPIYIPIYIYMLHIFYGNEIVFIPYTTAILSIFKEGKLRRRSHAENTG